MSLSVDIYKKIGDFILDVKFSTENNTTALFGLSGSGKSLTLKCIAGILTPDSGKIVINNKVVFDSEKNINLSPQKRNVGYLPQSYALFPNMNVKENITCGIKASNKKQKKHLAEDYILKFNLKDLEQLYPHQLSGGQQQRVALARALVTSPEVLLLDEPFSALDKQLKSDIIYSFIADIKSFNSDIVFVTHDKNEVYAICDNVCVIDKGMCLGSRSKKDVFLSPKNVTDAVLLEFDNIIDLSKNKITGIYSDNTNESFTSIAFYGDNVKINDNLCDVLIDATISMIVKKQSCITLILKCIKYPFCVKADIGLNTTFKIGDIVTIGINRKDLCYLK